MVQNYCECQKDFEEMFFGFIKNIHSYTDRAASKHFEQHIIIVYTVKIKYTS